MDGVLQRLKERERESVRVCVCVFVHVCVREKEIFQEKHNLGLNRALNQSSERIDPSKNGCLFFK